MKYFIKCLKSYFDFKGRARRKEYWFFTLFYFILLFLTSILDGWLFLMPAITKLEVEEGLDLNGLIYYLSANPYFITRCMKLTMVAGVLLIVPSYAVLARRLHDTGRSGWWALVCVVIALLSNIHQPVLNAIIGFIGFALFIVLIVWCFTDSQYETNQWGPCPKTEDGEDYVPDNDDDGSDTGNGDCSGNDCLSREDGNGEAETGEKRQGHGQE